MGHFERRFVRPTHLQVVDALEQAACTANEVVPVVEQSREEWSAFVSDIRSEAEGCRQWVVHSSRRGGGVGVAWWTDRLARRHFRIWAASSAGDRLRLLFPPDQQERPPLWHIAPENVFGRNREGQVDWLAVCACGMTGSPHAIGWMGDRCGMCHYIPAEAPAEAPVRLSSFHEPGCFLKGLTFSPDGRWLAGSGPGRGVHVWDVDAGAHHTVVYPFPVEIRAVTFSPDSRLLAVAGGDRMLRFLDVAAGKEVACYPTPKDVRIVAVAPNNLTMALGGQDGLEVWGRSAPSLPWLPVANHLIRAQSVAFSQSGDRMTAAASEKLVFWKIPERGGRHVWQWESCTSKEQFHELAFTGDGKCIVGFQLHTHSLVDGENRGYIRCWGVESGGVTSKSWYVRVSSSISRFSPCGQWLAGSDGNGILLESVRKGPWYELESGLGADLTAVAFSPDGETLASADENGTVRLWPWRRLLEA